MNEEPGSVGTRLWGLWTTHWLLIVAGITLLADAGRELVLHGLLGLLVKIGWLALSLLSFVPLFFLCDYLAGVFERRRVKRLEGRGRKNHNA